MRNSVIRVWFYLCTSLLLGCAGSSSHFECDATTSDQCMTMERANELARKKTEPAIKQPAGALPALIELPSAAPLKPSTLTVSTTEITTSVIEQAIIQTEALCQPPRCDTLGEATPLRQLDTIATVWIAPWVDNADVFHQPGRVSFVVTPGVWQLPQQIR